ncbi:MAG: S-layer family protein [Microcoleus sp. SIO2G3]|nr:S-layer family protein [Microcoleus sp. SIO2G3]
MILETRNLSVQNRGEVSTGVFKDSTGQAGNLSVTALDSVELVGGNLATATRGAGRAGDLTVTTQRLTAQDGGRVEAGTLGIGQGGNVTVNASESIDLSGFYAEGDILVFSGVSAKSGDSGNGGSGNVNLTTGELIIRDGAEIATATLGAGEGGDIQVQANSVSINNGGSITSRSTGEGNSGNVLVQANSLSISNSGRIISRSEGQSLAGDIDLRLQDTLQTNGGEISASSDQAGGGDINISAHDIFLRNGSLISSSVFDSTGGGGNITINSSEIFLALEDSDILANAEAGSGGNITINSPGFLADLFSSGSATPVGRNPGSFAQFRGNGRVDISAESQTGSSGRVTFPNVDPSRGAVSLPTDIVDASGLISSGCGTPQRIAQSRFIVSGRGGLPPTPSEILSSDTVWTDLRSTTSTTGNSSAQPLATQQTESSPKPLVEAQGWVISSDGQVILTAQTPTVTLQTPGIASPSCEDFQAVAN